MERKKERQKERMKERKKETDKQTNKQTMNYIWIKWRKKKRNAQYEIGNP